MNGIGPCVVWVDLMKFGTMSGKLLDNVMSTMNKFMRFRPQQTVGFMIAPFLCSDRLTNGLRDELRCLVYYRTLNFLQIVQMVIVQIGSEFLWFFKLLLLLLL